MEPRSSNSTIQKNNFGELRDPHASGIELDQRWAYRIFEELPLGPSARIDNSITPTTLWQ